jgi:hypothetical protein
LLAPSKCFNRDNARLEQLLAAKEGLAGAGAKIIVVAPGKICQPLRNLARRKILIADYDAEDVAATYGPAVANGFFRKRRARLLHLPRRARIETDPPGPAA